MRKKIDIKELIEDYQSTPNLHKLAKKYHTSHIYISSLLKEAGVDMVLPGKKKVITSEMMIQMKDDYLKKHLTTAEISEKYGVAIKRLRAEFKNNGIQISKWNGHIKKEVGKKSVKMIDERPVKICPLCGWKTYDVEGKTNAYYRHFLSKHSDIDLHKYIHDFPDEAKFFKGTQREEGKIQCKICGKYVSALDSRHLSKHGISKFDYLRLYPDSETLSIEYKKVLQNNLNKMLENPNWERFSSSYEKELQLFLKNNNIEFETHNRTILSDKREIDILIPSLSLGIEFNGCLQHTEWFGGKSRMYHLSKTMECNDKGIGLIHIFEDEYVQHRDIVLEKLRHILKKCEDYPKIMARKCEVKEIRGNKASEFLDRYHIQGSVSASIYLGAFYEDKLIGVMTFKKINGDNWELTRFASDYHYVCCGLGGKLFSFFKKKYNPKYIKSFADKRWTINEANNLYTNIGFLFKEVTPPNYYYYYTKDNKPERFHKFKFRKQTLSRKYGLPIEMSETEMVKDLGYDRIWDCGLIKYEWRRK